MLFRGFLTSEDGDRLITEINNLYRLDFLYDENGMLFGIVKDNKMYFYIRDSLGNILELVDEEGNCEASYDYTAYGECKTESTSTLSKQNPFRFKGYYYDTESGMYCIGNRFYVPEWCRWLTAEDPTNLNYTHPTCINLFTYCGSEPVNSKVALMFSDNLNTNSSLFETSRNSSMMINWDNNGFQIPIWISSLMSGTDFGASITPALRTAYQYVRYPYVKDLNKLYGQKLVPGKLNKICSIIGYGLLVVNISLSAYSNFTNENLTAKQQWISFGVDTAYTLMAFGIGYGVGAAVSCIPYVGIYIAPFAAAGVTAFLDWTNIKWGWVDDIKQWLNDL